MKTLTFGIIFCGMFFILLSCSKDPEGSRCDGYVPGSLIVTTYDSVPEQEIQELITSINLGFIRSYNTLNMHSIDVPVGQENYWREELEKYSIIARVSRNRYTCLY